MVAALSLHSVVDFRFYQAHKKSQPQTRDSSTRVNRIDPTFFEIKSAKIYQKKTGYEYIYTCP